MDQLKSLSNSALKASEELSLELAAIQQMRIWGKKTSALLKIRICHGFTLIEVIVAMILMSFVFAIGWTISNSFTGIKRIRNYETAISLASQAIEAVKTTRFRQIGSTSETRKDTLIADFASGRNMYDGPKGEGFVPEVKIGNTVFSRQLTVEECPSKIDNMPSGLILVRVVVRWKSSDDRLPLVFEAVTTVADQW